MFIPIRGVEEIKVMHTALEGRKWREDNSL